MSSFIKEAINPETGKKQKAFFIDDYYGAHRYGVGFRKDGKDADFEDYPKKSEIHFYEKEKINN